MNKLTQRSGVCALLLGLALTSGCKADPCADSTIDYVNNTDETVQITIDDQMPFQLDGQTSYGSTISGGTHRIQTQALTGPMMGQVIRDETVDFGCGLALPDYVLDNNIAEFDLTNSTQENLWVYIDGELQNHLFAGDTAQYALNSTGPHQIQIEDEAGNFIQDDIASGVFESFAPDTATSITITADEALPLIELSNDQVEGSGCVLAQYYAPDAAAPGTSVTFENSVGAQTLRVCPGEVGYFTVPAGNWTLEFDDATSHQSLFTTTQEFTLGTTTPFDLSQGT